VETQHAEPTFVVHILKEMF